MQDRQNLTISFASSESTRTDATIKNSKFAKMITFYRHEPRTQVVTSFNCDKFQRILIFRRRPMLVNCHHFHELKNLLFSLHDVSKPGLQYLVRNHNKLNKLSNSLRFGLSDIEHYLQLMDS